MKFYSCLILFKRHFDDSDTTLLQASNSKPTAKKSTNKIKSQNQTVKEKPWKPAGPSDPAYQNYRKYLRYAAGFG